MFYLTRFLIFLANLYIFGYVYLLEINKCDCSKDWRRDFIFYYSIVYIFTSISFLMMPEIFYQNLKLAILLKVILGLLLLVNIYCLYTYSEKLMDEKCKCSQSFAREFMKIFSYFYAVVLILLFIYLINYYVNQEYKNIKKIGFRGRQLTNNNMEKIVIVNKV